MTHLAIVTPERRGLNLAPRQVLAAVACYFGTTAQDLRGPRKAKRIAYWRQVGYWVMRDMTQYSTPDIGDAFGKRDHSTVLVGIAKVQRLVEAGDARTLAAIAALREALTKGTNPVPEAPPEPDAEPQGLLTADDRALLRFRAKEVEVEAAERRLASLRAELEALAEKVGSAHV